MSDATQPQQGATEMPSGVEWRNESSGMLPPGGVGLIGNSMPSHAAISKRHSWAARQHHGTLPETTAITGSGSATCGGPGASSPGGAHNAITNRALSLDSANLNGNHENWDRNLNLATAGSTPLGMRNCHVSPISGAFPQPQWQSRLGTESELHYNALLPHNSGPGGAELVYPVYPHPFPPEPVATTTTPSPPSYNPHDAMEIAHDPMSQSDQARFITNTQPPSQQQQQEAREPDISGCCGGRGACARACGAAGRLCANPCRRGCCACGADEADSDPDDEIYIEDDPFRKRCLDAFLNFVYVLLALIAVVVTYSMIQDLITAMNNPVRSIHYKKLKDYEAPGISMYPGGAKFLACKHYYNNIVTSKVRMEDLDLMNRNCTFTRLNYDDPHYVGVRRDVLVVRGPTSFDKREAIFLHFELEDETRDFFTVSYFVFPGWDSFNASTVSEQIDQLTDYHRYMPTFALSSGLRMWIKLIMTETYLMDGTKHTEFRVEYSVVKFWDRRPPTERTKHLFFIFFEWKNNIVEQSYLIHTTTPWSIGAGLCGVFLTLHMGYQLAQIGYTRARRDKERRSIRKRTIRELKKTKSMDRSGGSGTVNRKLRAQLSTS